MIEKSKFFEEYKIDESAFEKANLIWDDLVNIYNDYEGKKGGFLPTAKDISERLLSIDNVHSVRYRVKDGEHIIEKIIRKTIDDNSRNYTIDNYIDDISDIIGVRALHLFKDDWLSIDDFIIRTWKQLEKPTANIRKGDSEEMMKIYKEKDYEIKEHKYGYRSVHYIIETSPTKQSFSTEIQVRTLFEEAWSEIDHKIRYPYDLENPILKEYLINFNRLAGNADEMGTFIKFLQHELIEKDEELRNREKNIEELKVQIEQLQIDKKTKQDIDTKINTIFSNEVKTINISNKRIATSLVSDNISSLKLQDYILGPNLNTVSQLGYLKSALSSDFNPLSYKKHNYTIGSIGTALLPSYNHLSVIKTDSILGSLRTPTITNYSSLSIKKPEFLVGAALSALNTSTITPIVSNPGNLLNAKQKEYVKCENCGKLFLNYDDRCNKCESCK